MVMMSHYDTTWRGLTSGAGVSVEQVMQRSHASHDHDFYELVIVEAGNGVHDMDEGSTSIGPGSAFVIPPGVFHGYRNASDLVIWNVLILADTLRTVTRPIRSMAGVHALLRIEPDLRSRGRETSAGAMLALSAAGLKRGIAMATAIAKELQSRSPGWEAMCASELTQLFVHLAREIELHEGASRLMGVARALTEIESRYGSELPLAELATVADLSERTLLRRFREATGRSPNRYLLEYRIERACELLTSTALPITSIAFDVGIPDSSYFSRLFKRETGCAPREYRASNGAHIVPRAR